MFAHFINGEGGESTSAQYKRRFKRSVLGKEPKTAVAVFVLCADTEEKAEELAAVMDYTLAGEQGFRFTAYRLTKPSAAIRTHRMNKDELPIIGIE